MARHLALLGERSVAVAARYAEFLHAVLARSRRLPASASASATLGPGPGPGTDASHRHANAMHFHPALLDLDLSWMVGTPTRTRALHGLY